MLRLSRLTRAHPPASINVRYTAPGHANPYFIDRAHLIDPSHPAAKIPLRSLPCFVCPQFTLRAFPNAILHEPAEFVPINPLLATGLVRARTQAHARRKWWSNLTIDEVQQSRVRPESKANGKRITWTTFYPKEGHRQWDSMDAMAKHVKFITARQLADARLAALAKRGRRNISLLFHTSKKATSKSCVIRRKLRTKMTAAIGLVVGRNADAIAPKSDKPIGRYPPLVVVSCTPQELVLQDWTYLVVPNLAIYKTPLPNLVQAVRMALLSLSRLSKRLESSWSARPKKSAPSALKRTVDERSPSGHQHPNVGNRSHLATRTRKFHPGRSHNPSVADSDPVKRESVSTRLYTRLPIILSREES